MRSNSFSLHIVIRYYKKNILDKRNFMKIFYGQCVPIALYLHCDKILQKERFYHRDFMKNFYKYLTKGNIFSLNELQARMHVNFFNYEYERLGTDRACAFSLY